MSESAKHIVEGRRVEHCFYTRTQYGKCYHRQARCVTHFRRRASRIIIDCKRFQRYISKRSYPMCLCVTAFQLVHFQTAYHIAAGEVYITQAYEMGLPLMVTLLPSSTATGRNSRLQTLRDCNSILCGNAWVKAPVTLTTTKVQCEGCSTRLRGSL